MADQCIVVEETGYLTDTPRPGFGVPGPREVAKVTDALTASRVTLVTEALVVADAASYRLSAAVIEVAAIADAPLPLAHPRRVVSERKRARDSMKGGAAMVLADTLQAHDAALPGVRSPTLKESLRVADAALPRARPAVTLREAKRVRDSATGRRSSVLQDALHVAERFTMRRAALLAEVGHVAGGEAAERQLSEVVGEKPRAVDAAQIHVHALVQVLETAIAEDAAVLPTDGAAWTANTDSFAASRYTGFALNSLAVIDGRLYGAGVDGLYAIDGATDAGNPIAATILTGQQSPGSETPQRGGYLYARMRAAGLMQAGVRYVANGVPGAYVYPFEDRPADDVAPMRAKFGRGIKSLLWQFEVGNQAGASFRIDSGLTWVTNPGTRRV